MALLLDNAEKIVSLIIGLATIAGYIFWKRRRGDGGGGHIENSAPRESVTNSVNSNNDINNSSNQTVNVNLGSHLLPSSNGDQRPMARGLDAMDLIELKRSARILFVDDDKGFKIVGILKKMGWDHVKIVSDLPSLESPAVLEADVVFVDIQGVGRMMQYAEEGLGLALAIKRRHKSKKVIIYSSQEEGQRFHEALQEADYSLPKTAEPVRFEDSIVRVVKKA
jgi:hypothetical protein